MLTYASGDLDARRHIGNGTDIDVPADQPVAELRGPYQG